MSAVASASRPRHAVGATLPLLGFTLAGRQVADRVKAFRTRAPLVRKVSAGLQAHHLTFG